VTQPSTDNPTAFFGPAPILVLGIGNILLRDDGVGLTLLDQLQRSRDWGDDVDFVDGGTRGIVLLGFLENRRGLLILDAISLGGEPGTIHAWQGLDPFLGLPSSPQTAHEGNALQLLQTAHIMGIVPPRIAVVGIAPHELHTGIGLSDVVTNALPSALAQAESMLAQLQAETI
jgi:hydrogenase maturation protease